MLESKLSLNHIMMHSFLSRKVMLEGIIRQAVILSARLWAGCLGGGEEEHGEDEDEEVQ